MKMLNFSADELLAVAEEIERNGYIFYSKAAEAASDPSVGAMLRQLAEWEEQHYEIFRAMRAGLGEREKERTVFDPFDEIGLYLKAYASGKIIRADWDPESKAAGLKGLADVLDFALAIEKDSVVYYTGMRQLVPRGLGKDKIDRIIEEEMKHVAIIASRMAELDY